MHFAAPQTAPVQLESARTQALLPPSLTLPYPLPHKWVLMGVLESWSLATVPKILLCSSKQSMIHQRLFTQLQREEAREGRAEGWGMLKISQSEVEAFRELGEVPHQQKMGQDQPWTCPTCCPQVFTCVPIYHKSLNRGKLKPHIESLLGRSWALSPPLQLSQ